MFNKKPAEITLQLSLTPTECDNLYECFSLLKYDLDLKAGNEEGFIGVLLAIKDKREQKFQKLFTKILKQMEE